MIYLTKAEHDAFKAAVAERDQLLEQFSWLPINSAPRDGSIILIRNGKIVAAGCWLPQSTGDDQRVSDKKYPWLFFDADEPNQLNAFQDACITHWMPLPPPPKVAPTSEDEQEGVAP